MTDQKKSDQTTSSEKPWGGRFSEPTDAFVEKFTASVGFDQRLYHHDITGSIAHATMLAEVGVLTSKERDQIIEGLNGVKADIEADRIGDFDRALLHAEAFGGGIDLFGLVAFIDQLHGFEKVRRQDTVHEEAGRAFDRKRQLVDRLDKGEGAVACFGACLLAGNDLDQRHLRHRIEIVEADKAGWIVQPSGKRFQTDAGCVGRNDGAGLQLVFQAVVNLLLDLCLFWTGFDDEVGRADTVALRVANKAVLRRADIV